MLDILYSEFSVHPCIQRTSGKAKGKVVQAECQSSVCVLFFKTSDV